MQLNSQNRTVLLVEDNPTDLFVISEVLAASGLDLTVHAVKNGHDALLYLQALNQDENASCPALVLLDLNLPRVGGAEVLKELRRNSRCNRTPVIVVTSSAASADRVNATELGADGYFQKPADLAAYMELGGLITRVLTHKR